MCPSISCAFFGVIFGPVGVIFGTVGIDLCWFLAVTFVGTPYFGFFVPTFHRKVVFIIEAGLDLVLVLLALVAAIVVFGVVGVFVVTICLS